MARRDWLAPALVGAAVLVVGFLVAYHAPTATPAPGSSRAPQQAGWAAGELTWVFPDGPTYVAGNTTPAPPQLLVYDRDGPPHPAPPKAPGNTTLLHVDWFAPNLGVTNATRTCPLPCTPAPYTWRAAQPTSYHNLTPPCVCRLGRDGYNATLVAAYVFDAKGLLLASTEGDADTARFPHSGDYARLPQSTWYLGNGTPPRGVSTLPPSARQLEEPLRPRLDGLPIGGVATARITDGFVAQLYGPVWVTVQVRALAYAP